jgi:hypothetical protein
MVTVAFSFSRLVRVSFLISTSLSAGIEIPTCFQSCSTDQITIASVPVEKRVSVPKSLIDSLSDVEASIELVISGTLRPDSLRNAFYNLTTGLVLMLKPMARTRLAMILV